MRRLIWIFWIVVFTCISGEVPKGSGNDLAAKLGEVEGSSVGAVIAWLGGCSCAGSLRPLESGAPPLESANLRGKWVSTDDSSNQQEYFLVDSASADVYVVSSLKPNEKLTDVYEVSLVQVAATRSWTQRSTKPRAARNTGVSTTWERCRSISSEVWVEGDTLRLGLLNYDWLKQMISTGKVTLPSIEHHEDSDSLLLLTAESDKLAEFVRQYAEDPDAFSTVLTFHRVGPFENLRLIRIRES